MPGPSSEQPIPLRWDIPWRRGLPLLLLWILGILQLGFVIRFGLGGASPGKDFVAFYAVSKLVLTGGAAEVLNEQHLFALEQVLAVTKPHLAWIYPPVALVLLAPLAMLPYLPALAAWLIGTSLPLIIMIRRMIGLPLAVAAVLPALLHNVAMGQNGALTASILFGGVAALDRRRPWLAGAVFGLAIYKPQICLLIPVCLVAGRSYAALAAMAAMGVALVGASLILFGVTLWTSFLGHLSPQMGEVLSGIVPQNRFPTVFIAVLQLTGRLEVAQMAQAVSTVLAMVVVWRIWRRHEAWFPRLLILVAALPFSTPYALDYDLTLTAVPAACLFMQAWRGEASGVDWLALPVLWLMVPVIWVMGVKGLPIGLPLALLVMGYALHIGRRAAV